MVNWVDGPLLAALGRRLGSEVQFRPIAHRVGSNVLPLIVRVRE